MQLKIAKIIFRNHRVNNVGSKQKVNCVPFPAMMKAVKLMSINCGTGMPYVGCVKLLFPSWTGATSMLVSSADSTQDAHEPILIMQKLMCLQSISSKEEKLR